MTKSATDLSEFETAEAAMAGGSRLRVDVVLEALDTEKRALLDAALRGRYRPSVVAKVVSGWGHSLSDGAVKSWRSKNGLA